MKLKLFAFLAMALLLTGCGSTDILPSSNAPAVANRYLVQAIQKLSDSTRGTILVDSVDYICTYLYIESSEDASKGEIELCGYFIEYRRNTGGDLRYAQVLIGRNFEVDEEGFEENSEESELELANTIEQLDRLYAETLDFMSELEESIPFFSEQNPGASIEYNLIQGSFSESEIQRAMRFVS